ncbi:MAG: hypothetical protein ACFE0Q_05135 [Anaerolineae bacterium]
MNRDQQRESRTILRRIEAHLRQSHIYMGADEAALGFVDVIHHTTNTLRTLNYVTPRRNTAWVSGNHVQQGLDYLHEHGRLHRVRFVDGLYPPVFVRALRDLKLELEEEIPMMVYKKPQEPRPLTPINTSITFLLAQTSRDLAIWWYVWRNAYYDVAVSSVEPLLIGRDMHAVYFKHQINLVMLRHNYPIGVMRITLHEGTAHLVAHALLKELRQPPWEHMIRSVALDVALHHGADLVFVAGKTEDDRRRYREMGFIDSGSIVSYAESRKKANEHAEVYDDTLAQSVFII